MSCLSKRARERDAAFLKKSYVTVIPYEPPPETLQEAMIRHDLLGHMTESFPKPELQTESITNSNYETAKQRLGFKKHEKYEPKLDDRPMCRNSITFADTCLVYLVYEDDACRGEAEKDENTLDAASPLPSAEPNSTAEH
ncbi:hypothetical protein AAVH_07549 [Aphelenchoides avenae]|nr:hypothetical protein AAVH_07549 [Aphelenchus avenae]